MRRATLVAVFTASLAWNIVATIADPSWWAVPALFLGWYLADLLSGLVHMTLDYLPCPAGRGLNDLYFFPGSRASEDYRRLFRERMAMLGPLERLVYEFKNHHPRPDALGRRTVWEQVGSSVIAGALPASLAINVAWLVIGIPGWAMAGAVALIVGGSLAQYFHGSLHRARNPVMVRMMRRTGLLMTPAAHARHHATLQRDFSTNCGWSNPLLNALFRIGRQRGYFNDAGLEPHS